ncbi:MAG: hypothetical protein QOC65_755 [Sphingomonadales bacterium]|nr:hypothetical protein [Sphingomonadales bacterium]
MVCISRRPRCEPGSESLPEPLAEIIALLAGFEGALAALILILEAIGAISVTPSGAIVITTSWLGLTATAPLVGAAVAAVVAAVLVSLIAFSVDDRCRHGSGSRECAAGVVVEIVPSFSSTLDDLLPFTAMHDRVDLVTTSRFWNAIESSTAYVFCTDAEEQDGRSEILRCYFFEQRVCDVARGSLVGGIVGGVAGIALAALWMAAAGCALVITCLLALLLAALIAAAAVLAGALAGGSIARALGSNESPSSDNGATIALGQLFTVHGIMQRRAYDSGANVLYFVSSAIFHGVSRSPQPFSYCEIDEELPTDLDGCGRTVVTVVPTPLASTPPAPIPPPPLH